MLNDIKLLSGRVKKTPPTEVPSDRYEFIRLNDVEPDLGVPTTDNYILISNQLGQRNWVDVNSLVEGGFVPSGDIAKPQGQVVFGSGTGITTNSTFFWDDTNNRLGVGTTTPSAKIHSLATTEQLRLGYDATKYTKCSTDSNGNYSVQSTAGILQGSAVLSTSSTNQVALHTFATANFVSGEYIITAKQNSTVQITKILVVHDSSTASATEFGTVQTGSRLFTVEVDISSPNVRILITPASATATNFKTQFTLFGA